MNEIFNFLEFYALNLEKWNFEPIGNCVHTTEYSALEKTLLAILYLKLKVYITNLLSVYNLQKISCLKPNNFIWIFMFLRIPLTLKTFL